VAAIYTVIAHDLLVAGISLWLTLRLRFGPEVPAEYADALIYGVPLFAVIAGVMFHSFGMYRALWRYASLPDLATIIRAVTGALLVFWLFVYATAWLDVIPRSLPVIQWLLLVVMLGGSRVAIRMHGVESWLPMVRRRLPAVPVLVAGTTQEASLFVRASQASQVSPYQVLGILDDSGKLVGRSMHRVPIAGRIDQLRDVVARLAAENARPSQLVIATPGGSVAPDAFARLMDEAEELGLAVSRVPRMTELTAASVDTTRELRPVKLEDLLGRAQIQLDRSPITHLVRDRRVLITGAGGSIGSELARQVASLGPARLILLDSCELNLYEIDQKIGTEFAGLPRALVLCTVRDDVRIDNVFAEHQPDLVFHAAALKHIPLVEANPCDGFLTNTIGTKVVADAAIRHHAFGVIQVSTDKAIEPESVMGVSKRLAEHYCQALDVASGVGSWNVSSTRLITVRFGNVLGSSGSVLPLFQRQLSHGGPLTVTHPEMRRYFMTVGEAVELTLHASAHGLGRPEHPGQIFVLDMGEPVKIIDIARQLIRLAGLRPDIDVHIEITGLRPGERVDEHLFDEEEKQIPTSVAGVLRAVSAAPDLAEVERELAHLRALALADRPHDLRAVLARLCPSYGQGRASMPPREVMPERLFDRAHQTVPSFAGSSMPLTVGK
jgi:FlaA1/EpsC-like NDP-sugar epimerase